MYGISIYTVRFSWGEGFVKKNVLCTLAKIVDHPLDKTYFTILYYVYTLGHYFKDFILFVLILHDMPQTFRFTVKH